MLAALLTTVLWSLSVVFARRAVASLGSGNAYIVRQFLATGLLAIYAHIAGQALEGPGFWYFFFGGVVGFGLGDLALYRALPRIGSRLTILLCQCVAAPLAALIEWAWLGTVLTGWQMLGGAIILGGVGLAVAPGQAIDKPRRVIAWGVFWGLVAAFGQGYGAVMSRKAYDLGTLYGFDIDGGSAAYQRLLGGLVFGLFIHGLGMLAGERSDTDADPFHADTPPSQRWRRGLFWTCLTGLFGAVLGVSCYQWALSSTPSGIVLPIVATTPLVVIPFAYLMEGDRPTPRSLAGGVVAVVGAVMLALAA